jgi:L-alanine-DL-glutamate epimerase-like enolase superfamily enzyme
MRITDIREQAVKLDVNIRNAVFSFDDMTTSIVAVMTDVIRDGAPVTGYAFNSTGRYACGAQMRERLIPRILRQDPDGLLDTEHGGFDPEAIFRAMMFGEKPGGDMERSVGIGCIEVALWDAMAKIEEKPLHALIAERYGLGAAAERIFCYVGGGWYSPDETPNSLKAEMQGYLDQGYTLVKAKIGGLALDDDVRRIETILSVLDGGHQLAVDANCGLSPERALDYARALKPHGLRWFE